jgi:uncharacterized integral membrane protein
MQVLFTLAIIGVLVVFGLQNSEHVPISFIIGSPTKVRLVFLLLTSAAVGFLLSHIRSLGREIRLKKKIRALLAIKSTALARLPAERSELAEEE